MAITTSKTSLKNELNKANPSAFASLLQKLGIGGLLRAMKTQLMKVKPVVGADYQLATVDTIKLAEDAKAATVLRAYARTGTGTLGELTVAGYGATPTAGQIAVAPNGDIVLLATDAYTSVDVQYEPMEHDVVEFVDQPVVTGVVTIPKSATEKGVLALLEAEVQTGTITGKKGILVPLAGGGAGLPATTKAQLTSEKTTVSFNNATDAPLTARIKLAVARPSTDAMFTAESPTV